MKVWKYIQLLKDISGIVIFIWRYIRYSRLQFHFFKLANFTSFQQSQISDIIPAILSAEIVIAASNDWRLQEEIITHFVCFQHLTNSENIYHKIIPVLLIKLKKAVSRLYKTTS